MCVHSPQARILLSILLCNFLFKLVYRVLTAAQTITYKDIYLLRITRTKRTHYETLFFLYGNDAFYRSEVNAFSWSLFTSHGSAWTALQLIRHRQPWPLKNRSHRFLPPQQPTNRCPIWTRNTRISKPEFPWSSKDEFMFHPFSEIITQLTQSFR